MNRIVATSLSFITAFAPLASLANEEFATVEASRSFEGGVITTSLYAVGWQEPVDGSYIFDGVSLANGAAIPIRISLPLSMDLSSDLPETVQVEDVELTLAEQFGFETASAFVEKYFYTGTDGSNVVLTDDPIPLAVWLLVAGAAAIATPVVVCIVQNATSDAEERQTIEGSVTLGDDGLQVAVTCDF